MWPGWGRGGDRVGMRWGRGGDGVGRGRGGVGTGWGRGGAGGETKGRAGVEPRCGRSVGIKLS